MMPEGTILVADDDNSIRTVIGHALGREGYEVRSTSNAATLWSWVSEGEGDLVLTDVVMPDGDGLELLPRMRRVRPDLPIIVMSARNTLATAVKATQGGAYEYLPKPFDIKDLQSIINMALTSPHGLGEALVVGDEDAMPIIGKSIKNKNIFYAFGHQHIGWTLAAVTGKIIDSLIKETQPNIDIQAFSPNRF